MKFLILSKARSGTTWLSDVLNHVENVNSYYRELFKRIAPNDPLLEEMESALFAVWLTKNPGFRPFLTFKYLNEIYAQSGSVGFKFLLHQQRKYWEVLPYAAIKKISVIHLVRLNGIEVLVSKKMAVARGKFNYKTGEDVGKQDPVRIDIDSLIADLNYQQRWLEINRLLLRSLRIRHIEVYYEQFLQGPQNFQPVYDFLGLDFVKNPPTWDVVRVNKEPLSMLISNYSDVKRVLRDTKYARYLFNSHEELLKSPIF